MKFSNIAIVLGVGIIFLAATGCESEAPKEETFPRNLTLSKNSVEMDPLESEAVEILSGNGGYSVKSANPEIASASIVDGKVQIKGISTGKTSIFVHDRDGIHGLVSVLVYGELKLDKYEISAAAGDKLLHLPATPAIVKIVFGNGDYTVTSDGNVDFTVTGNQITVMAYQAGEITATVKDKGGQSKDFKIKSTDPYAEFKDSNEDFYFYTFHGPFFDRERVFADKVKDKFFIFGTSSYFGKTNITIFELKIPYEQTLSVGVKRGCTFYFYSHYSGQANALNAGSAASPVSVNVAVMKNDGKRVWIVFDTKTFSGQVCRPIPTP